MRILYPIYNARPFYDREATQIVVNYNAASVLPHALIQRDTYTVPAGKKAKITGMQVFAVRNAAATVGDVVGLYFEANVASVPYKLLEAKYYSISSGFWSGFTLSESIWLDTGDLLRIMSVDESTDGSNDFNAWATIAEYNK